MAFYRVAIYYRNDYGTERKNNNNNNNNKKLGKGKSYQHLKLLYGIFNEIIVN